MLGTAGRELRDHLAQCADCASEFKALQSRRERLDALLPHLALGAEPSPGLHSKIMTAIEASQTRRSSSFSPMWAIAGATAVTVLALGMGTAWKHRTNVEAAELRSAQALAQWHAPTDVLLQTPGHELLSSVPRLGESYIRIPIETERKQNRRGGNQ